MLTIDRIVLLLSIATLVALAARRLKLPYTVGLVITGIALALARANIGVDLTSDLIFKAFLPPLLFEAALSIHYKELRRDALPITVLAVFGVIFSAIVVMAGMTALAHWPWQSALIFGVLIAATDPVSVIAVLKENKTVGRLRLLMESESLFNDGVAAVLFTLAMSYLGTNATRHLSLLDLAKEAPGVVLGGIVIGGGCGLLAILLMRRTSEYLVETALTAVVAYGSFLIAQDLHASGVLATVTAGLILGNVGVLSSDEDNLSERGREVVIAFWDFAAFVANSLIFLLIGLKIAFIPMHSLGIFPLVLGVALTLAGRAVAVYPLCLLFRRTRYRVLAADQHMLFWGGLRGALGLALALSLPAALPYHDQIVAAAFTVVAFSIIVQGVTMPTLVKKLKK